MSQRERTPATEHGAEKVGVYETTTPRATTTRMVNTETPIATKPTDLVRWGPVIAGIFAALATLITLSVLGIAVGLSSFNYGDPASSFGIGAGIWGAISALIAFLVGGWIAGRGAAFNGRTSGIMNGAMVWFVAIPLLIYLLGSGIGALARTAGSVAGTAATVAGQTVGAAASNPALQATANDPALQATVQSAPQAVQATAQALANSVTPQDVNNAADNGANAAWSVLLSLGLMAGAAILGGYLGSRPRDPNAAYT